MYISIYSYICMYMYIYMYNIVIHIHMCVFQSPTSLPLPACMQFMQPFAEDQYLADNINSLTLKQLREDSPNPIDIPSWYPIHHEHPMKISPSISHECAIKCHSYLEGINNNKKCNQTQSMPLKFLNVFDMTNINKKCHSHKNAIKYTKFH